MKLCPFCAEKIQKDAIKCRYCQTMLSEFEKSPPSKSVEAPPKPGIFRLLFWNLCCPGFGAWRLGHRWRGGIVLLVLLVATGFWFQETMEKVEKIKKTIAKTKKMGSFSKLIKDLAESTWYDLAYWTVIFSFVDLIWLFYTQPTAPDKKKVADETPPNPP